MTHKYYIILILSSLIFYKSSAQRLIRKEITDIHSVTKIYHVLEGDQTIRHGGYISLYPVTRSVYLKNGKNDSLRTKEIGSYYFNSKNGEWITYDKPSVSNGILTRGKVLTRGIYVFNMKYGNWMETDDQGKIQYHYYKIYIDTSGRNLNRMIAQDVYYPEIAFKNKISGDVVFGYKILQDCSIDSIQFIKQIGYGCDESAFQSILKNHKGYPCNNEFHIDTTSFRLISPRHNSK